MSVAAHPEGALPSRTSRQRGLIVIVAALFITQGIPIGLIFESASALLRADEAPLSVTAALPLLLLPWVFKFLWAPAIDNNWVGRIGRRRTWILPLQTALAASIAALAFVGSPAQNIGCFFLCLGFASLFSATQDIATDGLAAERLTGAALAWANGFQIGGFAIGMLIGGPLALFLSSRYGTPSAFAVAAIVVILALIPVLLWREPEPRFIVTERASIRRFVKRPGAGRLLVFAAIVAAGRAAEMALSKPFLVDHGVDVEDIAVLSMIGLTGLSIVGSALASVATARFGAWPVITTGLLVALAGLLTWVMLALGWLPVTMPIIAATVFVTGIASGLCAVGGATLFMRLAAPTQTGTDVTILQSSHVLAEVMVGGVAGSLAASFGYISAFAMAAWVAASAVALTLWLRRGLSAQMGEAR